MSYNSPSDQGSRSRLAYGAHVRSIDVDLGLRQYMLQVYNFMAAGLGLTGLVAYAAVATGFTGLTAWDTQRIKEVYLESDPRDVMSKKALMGALSLYLDFINLFVMLLQLVGQRRE